MSNVFLTQLEAKNALSEIHSLLLEFEGAKTIPNVLVIDEVRLLSVKKYFPYLFEEESFIYNKLKIKVIISLESYLGVAFAFDRDFTITDLVPHEKS